MNYRALFGAACFVVLAFTILPAAAQETAVPIGTSVWAILEPYLVTAFGALISVAVGWLALVLNRKWGLDIEANHREALQTALTNAAGLAIKRLGTSVNSLTLDVSNPAIREAVNYVMGSAKDALKRFGLGPEDVAQKIIAKLGLSDVKPAP